MNTMEQARRELKEQAPDLYNYITAIEGVRILDAAEQYVSSADSGWTAAGKVREMMGTYRKRAAVLQLAQPPRRR